MQLVLYEVVLAFVTCLFGCEAVRLASCRLVAYMKRRRRAQVVTSVSAVCDSLMAPMNYRRSL